MQEAPYAFGSTHEREAQAPESRWRQTITDRARFVVEVDGVVAGTVSGGADESAGAAAMTGMWVDPRYRRRGIGELLVRHVIEWARSVRYEVMFLWVTDVNVGAQRLYERSGFINTGAAQEIRPGELEHEMSRKI